MTIAAHAPPPLLAAYATGSLPEGMSMLLACHLTLCPCCRKTVARLEELGGALLADAPPESMAPPRLEAALARIEAGDRVRGDVPPGRPGTLLPAPLRRRLGCCESELRWRRLVEGTAEHRIAGFVSERVSLFRARPGACIPRHGDPGPEATLVLCGRMRDGEAELGPGDLALTTACDRRGPEIVGRETCICLAVQAGHP